MDCFPSYLSDTFFQKYNSSIPSEDQQTATELNEGEEEAIVKAIEQIQYFVDDVDHAKGVLCIHTQCIYIYNDWDDYSMVCTYTYV